MQVIIKIIDKIIELLLFLILLILPFAYSQVSFKQSIFFLIIMLLVSSIFIKRVNNILKTDYWRIFLAVIFMFAFDFSEKVNFIHVFNISKQTNISISLSSILLLCTLLAYVIKILINRKLVFPNQPYTRYLLISFACLSLATLFFYPVICAYYPMGFDADFQFLDKLMKYFFILLIVTDYLDDKKKAKRMSISIVSCMLLCLITIVIISNLKGN